MDDRTLMRAMIAVVSVDAVIAIVLRAELGAQYVRGDRGIVQLIAIVGLASSIVVAFMLWRVSHGYAAMKRRSDRSGERMSAVMETSHELLWEATPDLTFVFCSASASEILGYTPEEMVGRSAFDLVDDDFVPIMRRQLRRATEERCGWRNLYARWRHKDGSLVAMTGSAVPVLDERGDVIAFRGARQPVGPTTTEPRLESIRVRTQDYIDRDVVSIALQPVVSLHDGRWHGVEALSRFPDDLPPDRVFAEAREVGLGVDLELVTLRHALDHLIFVPEDVTMAVNVSAELILDHRFHAALMRPDVDLSRILLEVTEHTAIDDYDALRAELGPLRALGVKVVVDDTGAGYASFRHVLELRPDAIKLDRSLLSDLRDNPAARALVNAVVMLALELGASVTAEGIEDYGELDGVAALGVDDAQGYFLGKPSVDPIVWSAWTTTDWLEMVGKRAPLGSSFSFPRPESGATP